MKHTSHSRAGRFLSSLFYFFSIFIFINAFNFQHNPPRGWYRQFLPANLPPLNNLTFKDSLTGYGVTVRGSDGNSYVIRTTNGGDNWNYVLTESSGRMFTDVEFLDANTGFVCTDYQTGGARLLATTNGGNEWNVLNNPSTYFTYEDMFVLSENEIWAVNSEPLEGGVFRTTNGGTTWQWKYYNLSHQADRIYMINSRIGFISDGDNVNSWLRKTTDAGDTWVEIPNGDGWYNIFFQDTLTGWRAKGFDLQKTTDGGMLWTTLLQSSAGNPDIGTSSFSVLENNTIWSVDWDANILFPNNQLRGVIFNSTDAGVTWGYQLPDTSFGIRSFGFCQFLNPRIGWAYKSVHTITGGDTTTYPLTSVSNQSENVPSRFKLHQNYPNPFNPNTIIEYELPSSNIVMLKVFDSGGREVQTLANARQHSGKHIVEFDGSGLPSGVYFYTLYLESTAVQSRKMVLIR